MAAAKFLLSLNLEKFFGFCAQSASEVGMSRTRKRIPFKPYRKELKENRKRTYTIFRRKEKAVVHKISKGEIDPEDVTIQKEPHTEGRETW